MATHHPRPNTRNEYQASANIIANRQYQQTAAAAPRAFQDNGQELMRPRRTEFPVSVGAWIGTFILSAIPLVNIICLFMWAFGSAARASKRNYARAVLLLSLIGIIIAAASLLLAIFAFGVSFDGLLAKLGIEA